MCLNSKAQCVLWSPSSGGKLTYIGASSGFVLALKYALLTSTNEICVLISAQGFKHGRFRPTVVIVSDKTDLSDSIGGAGAK
jgi:hypothetical protein